MRETWYVLEDDSAADPNEVAPDESGALRHKDGRAVAMGPYGPRSRGVDVPARVAESPSDRQMKPAGGGKYKTR